MKRQGGLGRLTHSQIVATVCAVTWATCPFVFAAERGKQMARQVVRDKLERVVGVEQADSLLDQMRGMDVGSLSRNGDYMTLQRPEGTYVFEGMERDVNGQLSGVASIYDANGEKTGEITISHVTVLDDNRIDFSVSVASPERNLTESGTITGIKGDAKGLGVAFISTDGSDTRPVLMNYGSLAVSGPQALPLPLISPLVGLQLGGVATGDDLAAGEGSCEPAAVAWGLLAIVAICVAVVVVIVVVISCYAYCFPSVCC